MTFMAVSRMATRRVTVHRSQQRGIINWMVNYPDKVMEIKKIQMKGGTRLGEDNPTWLKQPGDRAVLAFGAGVVAFGMIQVVVGIYNLAFNKNKKE